MDEKINLSENTPSTASLAGYKILLIEDDTFLRDLMAQKLLSHNADLLQAGSAEDALSILAQTVPDVILLDLVLPSMSGYDLLKKIKADPRQNPVTIIVLSNLGKVEDVEAAKQLGVSKYIVKVSKTPGEIMEEIIDSVQQRSTTR